MSDVFDYLAWRGDLPFDTVAPNEADRLIFCMLSFMDFEGIVSRQIARDEISIKEAAGRLLSNTESVMSVQMRRFGEALMHSKRFGSVLLSGYRTKLSRGDAPDCQLQFAALTARFASHLSVIYRGTDDTLVGWKENFNSDLVYPIPAQKMAAAYLEQASGVGLPMVVQGHSKGGNLSVYAGVASSVPTLQILRIYDFDGPGFDGSFFKNERYGMLLLIALAYAGVTGRFLSTAIGFFFDRLWPVAVWAAELSIKLFVGN